METLFSLKGKNALVTGGSGHLGSVMCLALARQGANVYINSRKKNEKLNGLVNKIRKEGFKAETLTFDISDFKKTKNKINSLSFPIHILINNAYSGEGGTIESSENIDYETSFNKILISSQYIFKCCLPLLRKGTKNNKSVSVINISSIYGQVSPNISIYPDTKSTNPPFYGSAKAALIQWTKYAACEFGKENIRINSISPGAFPSSEYQKKYPEIVKKISNMVPMKRIGDPNELKGVIIFLASEGSSYINGQNITIDGGWTAW